MSWGGKKYEEQIWSRGGKKVPFRLSESCSHEVGLLFLLEECISSGKDKLPEDPVGTEGPCLWKNPGPLKESPLPLSEVHIWKPAPQKRPRLVPPSGVYYREHLSSLDPLATTSLYQRLAKVNPTCPFVTHFAGQRAPPPLFHSKEIPCSTEFEV